MTQVFLTIGGVILAVLGFFVVRLVSQLDGATERLRIAELALARFEGLPKTIERDLEALREDLQEVKATLKEWHEALYRAKTSTSSAGHYAVRPQQSPTPPPPRPRDPRRDR